MQILSKLRKGWLCCAGGLLLVSVVTTAAWAQVSSVHSVEEGSRKIRSKSAVVYPDLARRMYVSGKVKLELVVSPEGKVRQSRVLGGHPLLAQAAQEAVRGWKFESAKEESTVLVEFTFQLNDD